MGKTEQKQEKQDDRKCVTTSSTKTRVQWRSRDGGAAAGSGTGVPGRASQRGGPGLRPVGWAADAGGGMRQVCKCWRPSAGASGGSPGQRPTGGVGCSTSGAAIPTRLLRCPRVPQLDRGSASPRKSSKRPLCRLPSPSIPTPGPASQISHQLPTDSSFPVLPLGASQRAQRMQMAVPPAGLLHIRRPPRLSSQARPRAPLTCPISRAQVDRWGDSVGEAR